MCRKIIFDYSKLKGRIIEKYNSQSKFAEAVGISDRSMSLKLNNGIGLSQEDIVKWSKLLAIDSENISSYFFNQEVS